MKQALNKLGVEGKILQHRKTIYDKPKECVNTILNSKKLKVFPQRQGTRQGCQSQNFDSIQCWKLALKINGIQIRKEEVKLSLSDEMILYIENPNDNNKIVKINTFNTFSG